MSAFAFCACSAPYGCAMPKVIGFSAGAGAGGAAFGEAASSTAAQVERNMCITSLERLGAGDDLHELLGDRRLPGAVVEKGQRADHLAGVLGRVLHRRHARTMLACRALEQRPEDADVQGLR